MVFIGKKRQQFIIEHPKLVDFNKGAMTRCEQRRGRRRGGGGWKERGKWSQFKLTSPSPEPSRWCYQIYEINIYAARRPNRVLKLIREREQVCNNRPIPVPPPSHLRIRSATACHTSQMSLRTIPIIRTRFTFFCMRQSIVANINP